MVKAWHCVPVSGDLLLSTCPGGWAWGGDSLASPGSKTDLSASEACPRPCGHSQGGLAPVSPVDIDNRELGTVSPMDVPRRGLGTVYPVDILGGARGSLPRCSDFHPLGAGVHLAQAEWHL